MLRLDTGGAWLLARTVSALEAQGVAVSFEGTNTAQDELLRLARAVPAGPIPPADVAEGRASRGWESAGPGVESRHKFRLLCSEKRPKDAFVTVPYRDHWFWIDDRDLASKRHFAFVMYLFTLADTAKRGGEPVLTIPT